MIGFGATSATLTRTEIVTVRNAAIKPASPATIAAATKTTTKPIGILARLAVAGYVIVKGHL